jgi:hypothetical protein
MIEDPRSKTKYYLEYYDAPANITKDDGTTQASYIYQFEKPPYPLKRVFFDPKNKDGIYTIGTPDSDAVLDWKHEAYAYDEKVPITIDAVTKHGINGDRLRWKMEAELRRIVETYPLGSIRSLTHMTPLARDMGIFKLHTVTYNLRYKRPCWTYTSDCSLSYGGSFTYDGDRITGGVEGDWDINDPSKGSYSITDAPGFMKVTRASGDVFVSNDDSTYAYADDHRVRCRYRTPGNAAKTKAQIELDGTPILETAEQYTNGTFKVVDKDLDTLGLSGIIDTVKLHASTVAGDVYYDFLQIYKDDFVFPNVVDLQFIPASRNVQIPVPGRIVDITQNLGAPCASITMQCDLDMSTQAHRWKRAGDVDDGDVFLDVAHNQSVAMPFAWLVWGNKQCKVTLDEPTFDLRSGELRLTFHEYSDSNKASEYYYQRWSQDT